MNTEALVTPDRKPHNRAALLLAAGSVLVWLALCTWLKPAVVADEWRHFVVIEGLTRGEWPPAGYLPMLPTYHLLAAGACRVFGTSLLTVRALNAGLSLVAIALVYAIARHRQDAVSRQILLFAWNPLLLPYLVLGYTEVATLVALLAALYLHLRGRLVLSATALLVACLLRQSSIVWAVFFVAWGAVDLLKSPRIDDAVRHDMPTILRRLGSKLWGHALLIAVAGVLFIVHPSFAAGSEVGNRAGVNVAQFYSFGLAIVILWLPLWIEEFARAWPTRLTPALARGVACALALAAVGLLEMGFRNPHPWNVDPQFLRNWVLTAMMSSLALRLLVAACIVIVAVLVVIRVRSQPNRALLGLVWVSAMLYIAPHWLVDPRYYILPTVFVNLFSNYTRGQGVRLACWQLAASAAICAYILAYGNPDGGLL